MTKPIDISVVVPVYNEEDSLPQLVDQLLAAMRPIGDSFELVLVNDGSSDKSGEVLTHLSSQVPELVCVLLRKNYGQTAAMAAGFDFSSGEIIVSLDGDLQNDPADIPLMVSRLKDGFDDSHGRCVRRRYFGYDVSKLPEIEEWSGAKTVVAVEA